MLKYKNIYNFFFLQYMKMEPTTSNNDINAIKEAREVLNDLKSNLSSEETKKLEKNSIKKELFLIF